MYLGGTVAPEPGADTGSGAGTKRLVRTMAGNRMRIGTVMESIRSIHDVERVVLQDDGAVAVYTDSELPHEFIKYLVSDRKMALVDVRKLYSELEPANWKYELEDMRGDA
jgi:hypothetical protein